MDQSRPDRQPRPPQSQAPRDRNAAEPRAGNAHAPADVRDASASGRAARPFGVYERAGEPGGGRSAEDKGADDKGAEDRGAEDGGDEGHTPVMAPTPAQPGWSIPAGAILSLVLAALLLALVAAFFFD